MIRPYMSADKPALLELLQLNTPQYFHPSETKDFEHYLEHELESYYVLEQDGVIVGCGGINYFKEEKLARLSWDMVHPKQQGNGIGRKLATHRINEISSQPKLETIVVRTTQLVYPFYQKLGFALQKTVKNYWAEGFDLYEMHFKIKL
ncbi:GNAT family N-acetyltransferase [Pontibacter sp. H259]|uniref:GNAT family N-acetyltransferase n=1 Tax=Pontibacter sp. H259 TaxID=3133421 RepID=UPI0030BBAC6D